MDKENLLKKIEVIEEQRKQFIERVNQTLGEFSGRVAMLNELIQELEEKDE